MKTHRTALATLAALLFGLAAPANAGEPLLLPTGCHLDQLQDSATPWDTPALERLGESLRLPSALLTAPDPSLSLLIKTLGQLIVESQLQRAAVSGRFDPVIVTVLAGSRFDLRVCRETIVGAVSVDSAAAKEIEFMIGDFDHDGRVDVALRRAGSDTWIMDFAEDGASSPVSDAPKLSRTSTTGDVAPPRVDGCRIAWVAGSGQSPRGAL